LEARSSEVEKALDKVNIAFREFTSLYGILVERGIEEIEYGKIFDDMAQDFRRLYATAKSHYDALLLNRQQFDEGRLERDAFERSLIRIERYIIDAEFEIGTKILPHLKKVEKELLQKHIIKKIEDIDMPEEMKREVRQDAEKIQAWMTDTEKKDTIDQVKEYASIGGRIIELGEKVWKFAKMAAPVALPFILRIFGAS
jgi:hypothetical protein